MQCEIWGFHGCDYEECRLMGCNAVWLLYEVSFRSVLWLLVTANVDPSSFLVIPMMEPVRSPETSVLTWSTWRHIPEDGIIQTALFFFSTYLEFLTTDQVYKPMDPGNFSVLQSVKPSILIIKTDAGTVDIVDCH
jgi:hypothetical protein